MSATENIKWPQEWPVWWDTGDGRPAGSHMAKIIDVLPYTGQYPQWFTHVLRLASPNTRKGWTEMAANSKDIPQPSVEDTKVQLSSAEYVALGGAVCPHCKSSDIQGGSFNHEDGEVSQSVDCLSCDAQWVDVYVLDRYFE